MTNSLFCNMKKAKVAPVQIRALIPENSFNEENNTVEVVFATETPVKRYDWNEGCYFNEVLDISKEAINFERLNNGLSVLDSHASYRLDAVLGVVESAWIDEKTKEARAIIKLSNTEKDADIISKVKQGIIRNISVGYKVDEYTVSKNGKEIPEYRATKWTPNELSFVSVPADFNSGVRSEQKEENFNLINIMDEDNIRAEEVLTPPKVQNAPTPEHQINESDVRAQAVSEERQRVSDISDVCQRAGLETSFADSLIKNGTSLNDARALIIDEVAKRANPAPVAGAPVVQLGEDEAVKTRNSMVEGIVARAIPGSIDLKGNEKAQQFRNMRLLDVAKDRLRASGENFSMMSEQEMVKRAWATTDFPTLLSMAFDRSLRKFYEGYTDEWQFIARAENATDFREKTGIKVDGAVSFDEIPEGGEYKESNILQAEEAKIKLKKFGRKYSISDIAIINDDLSVFSRLPQIMAMGAQQFQSDLVWSNITGNKNAPDGKPLFHADHKNFDATGALLTQEALSAARTAMRRQKSPAGLKLGIRPHYLLVPPELQTTAEKLVSSVLATATGDVNVFANQLKVMVSDQLEDPKAWYLLADPSTISADGIVYAYLNSQPGLRTESRVNWDTDALEVKGSMAFATAVWGWEGWYKNKGK